MLVATILQTKGRTVHTVGPDETTAAVVAKLSELNIGALVVSSTGRTVEGIISERDIVRGLAEKGAKLLEEPVSKLMTADVRTCAPQDTSRGVLAMMTEGRIRHLPVIDKGELCGLISIGDAVKSRLDEITSEAHALREYIAQT